MAHIVNRKATTITDLDVRIKKLKKSIIVDEEMYEESIKKYKIDVATGVRTSLFANHDLEEWKDSIDVKKLRLQNLVIKRINMM